jgi:hypothetical protein
MAQRIPRPPRAKGAQGGLAQRCHSEAELRDQLRLWASRRIKERIGFVANDAAAAIRSFYRETEKQRSATLRAGTFAQQVRSLLRQATEQLEEEAEETMTSASFMLALRLLWAADDPRLAWLSDEDDRTWQEWALAKEQPVSWRVIAVTMRLLRRSRHPAQRGHPAGEGWLLTKPERADYAAVHVLAGQELPANWSKSAGVTVSEAIHSLKERYKAAIKHLRKKKYPRVHPGEPGPPL